MDAKILSVLPVLRLILAGVFALAGVTKFLDRRGSRQSLQDFGVPEGLIQAFAIALPAAELLTALALLPQATAFYGALGAAALLSAFIAAVAVSLLRGRRPDCHCFGQLHSEPIGWQVLARNAALLFAAVFVIVRGWPGAGAGAGDWFLSLQPAWRATVAVGVIGVTAYAVRAIGRARVLRNAPLIPDWSSFALAVGEPAPEFSLADLDVEAIIDEIAAVFPSAPRPDLDVRTMLDSFLQTGLIVAEPALAAGATVPRAAGLS